MPLFNQWELNFISRVYRARTNRISRVDGSLSVTWDWPQKWRVIFASEIYRFGVYRHQSIDVICASNSNSLTTRNWPNKISTNSMFFFHFITARVFGILFEKKVIIGCKSFELSISIPLKYRKGYMWPILISRLIKRHCRAYWSKNQSLHFHFWNTHFPLTPQSVISISNIPAHPLCVARCLFDKFKCYVPDII